MARSSRLCLPLLVMVLAVGGGAGAEPPAPAPAPAPRPSAAAKPPRPPEKPEPGVPDAALQAAINAAIDKGAAWLRSQQKSSGWMAPVVQRGESRYEIGSSALAGLALLAAGDRPGSGVVDRIMDVCRAKDKTLAPSGSRTTYDAGVLIMFVTEYYRSRAEVPAEKGHTRESRPIKNPCALPEDVRLWVQEMATWLVEKQQDSGGWGYPAHRVDLSNTQYAILGIRAARDCGAVIPASCFEKALKLALDWQEKDGPKDKRLLPSGDPTGKPYVIEAGDRSRGWTYLLEPYNATGSMTTSGLAILSIAHDALLRPRHLERYDAAAQGGTSRALQDGFAWLEQHWTVTRNPGPSSHNWHLYYLYGLERACALAERPLVGLIDWYVEGAKHLVGAQKPDGRWSAGTMGFDGEYEASDVLDTAWALLFLKRATRPVVPIPAPVISGGH